jgi:hypothetical protein
LFQLSLSRRRGEHLGQKPECQECFGSQESAEVCTFLRNGSIASRMRRSQRERHHSTVLREIAGVLLIRPAPQSTRSSVNPLLAAHHLLDMMLLNGWLFCLDQLSSACSLKIGPAASKSILLIRTSIIRGAYRSTLAGALCHWRKLFLRYGIDRSTCCAYFSCSSSYVSLQCLVARKERVCLIQY